jgi:hypothetical protein
MDAPMPDRTVFVSAANANDPPDSESALRHARALLMPKAETLVDRLIDLATSSDSPTVRRDATRYALGILAALPKDAADAEADPDSPDS